MIEGRLIADLQPHHILNMRSVTPPGAAMPSTIGFAASGKNKLAVGPGMASHSPEGGALNGEAGSRRRA